MRYLCIAIGLLAAPLGTFAVSVAGGRPDAHTQDDQT